MKKLSLENLKLEADDMLQRNQLKAVFGGYYGGPDCTIYCKDSNNNILGEITVSKCPSSGTALREACKEYPTFSLGNSSCGGGSNCAV